MYFSTQSSCQGFVCLLACLCFFKKQNKTESGEIMYKEEGVFCSRILIKIWIPELCASVCLLSVI